ncbi:MAG: phosphopantothenoylcysteine decarboxylase [Planctomycetota bacterium]|nr:phosphopantothenoylcysteine decarboxylase [Planctomycetota bacterium]
MRFLITAGGTREYIDPVRFITNASSGRMGYALAQAATRAGHKVTLVTAPASQQIPRGAKAVKVVSAAEMFQAVRKNFPACDCLIMAAAVSDYTPVKPSKTKVKKTAKTLTIKLKPTADILKWAGQRKSKIKNQKSKIVVGFALEDKNLRANAEKKLKAKKLDMIIANSPAAIGADKSGVQLKTACCGWVKFENASKIKTAKKIIRRIEKLSL